MLPYNTEETSGTSPPTGCSMSSDGVTESREDVVSIGLGFVKKSVLSEEFLYVDAATMV